jgi:CHAD domain-containing protein
MPPASPGIEPVLTALQAQVEALHAREPEVRASRDPEDLRRMRITVRRLRAILRASRPLFGRSAVDGLRDELGWLGTALGRVRDLDMVGASVAAELGSLEGSTRRESHALLRGLDAGRTRARGTGCTPCWTAPDTLGSTSRRRMPPRPSGKSCGGR